MYICVEHNVAGVYFKLSTSNGCLHLHIYMGCYINGFLL